MIKVKFFIRNPKEGLNTVLCRVKNGRKLDLTAVTKETTSLEDWNPLEGKLHEVFSEFRNGKNVTKNDAVTKARILDNRVVNDRLEGLRRTIENSYKESDGNVNSQWLKDLVFPPIEQGPLVYDITEYCDEFLVARGDTIKNRYRQKIEAIQGVLNRYKAHRKIRKLLLPELDNSFRNDFTDYCKKVEMYKHNYIENCIKVIKTMLYHAKANGHEINEGLRLVKAKLEKTTFQYLAFEEIDVIAETSFDKEHLETTRDWLVISCYLGQRVSDFMRFDTSMISEREVKGQMKAFIEFTQVKTGKTLLLPIHDKIITILEKRNWAFPPKMSEQKYNLHVKEVCRIAGIDELVHGYLMPESENDSGVPKRKVAGMYPKYKLISSHVGRRSFASNYFGKIPTPLLMNATGHGSEAMLLTYIQKIDLQQGMALAQYL